MKMKRILWVVLAFMLCASVAWAGTLEEGVAAFEAKQYEKAVPLLQTAADKGASKAQGLLARLYAKGWGVAKDRSVALKWARLAAKQNDAAGQNVLGVCYRNGFGVEKNYSEALKWFRRAVDQGDALGQSNLGFMYRNGYGVDQNYGEALKWFRLAADQGDAFGQAQVGYMYLNGYGVSIDYADALEWFRLAAEQGDEMSQGNLGYMYRDGLGVVKDYAEAVRWFQLAANQGGSWSQNELGRMYLSGHGVSKDYAQALNWFRLSANQGDSHGQANVGYVYELGLGVAQDFQEAARWYVLSAAQGNAFAKAKLDIAVIKNAAEKMTAQSETERQHRTELVNAEAEKSRVNSTSVMMAQRRALVIGNDAYQHVGKLHNAREDAKAVADGLTRVGYLVTLALDVNQKEMEAALRTFKGQIDGGDEVMIFYAGHGVQISAANYLLPIDIVGGSEDQIKDDAVQLQRLLDDMGEKKAKFTLAMIDACRDNPFKTMGRHIGGRGLSPTTAATGQMIVFSAGTGQQALDTLGDNDKDKNGLFVRVFLKEMQRPGVTIDRVIRKVREEVVDIAKSVGHEQVPAIYDQVVGDFYFRRSP
jgi:TPR repeat protein